MKASLYLCKESMIHNGIDNDKEVFKKLINLNAFLTKIPKEDNEILINQHNLTDTILFSDRSTIGDIFLKKKHISSKDIFTLIQRLFTKYKHCNCTPKELLEYLELESEDECNAIIVINPIEDLPESKQILASIEEWLNFRRYYLAKYPKDAKFFIKECKVYFPNLIFHHSVEQSISGYLKMFSKQIIEVLKALNDDFLTDLHNSKVGFPAFLDEFGGNHGYETSFQGRKDDAKFLYEFDLIDKETVIPTKVYCEPHMKIKKDDYGNYNQHCRIYFNSHKFLNNENVYIAHIGDHK